MKALSVTFDQVVADALTFPQSYEFGDILDDSLALTDWIAGGRDGAAIFERYTRLYSEVSAMLRAHGRADLLEGFEFAALEHHALRLNLAYRLGVAVGMRRAAETLARTGDLLQYEASRCGEGDPIRRKTPTDGPD